MTPIVSFTLTSPGPDKPRTEATLFEIAATRPTTTGDGLCVPGFSAVQIKETSVRLRSALSLDAPIHARLTFAAPVKAGKPGLPGYSLTPASGMACALDLPIACALLEMGKELSGLAVAGELGLDGSLRPIRGVLAFTLAAKAAGLRGVVVPIDNVREALVVTGMEVHGVSRFDDVSASVARRGWRSAASMQRPHISERAALVDFADVRGNAAAVTALSDCVAGHADAVLVGPPSTHKTMLARRVPTIMLPLTPDQQLEVTKAYSAVGLATGLITERPFRAPHHTISALALLGGNGRPGEVDLAAYGVLLLDEVQEFSMAAMAALVTKLAGMGAARPMVIVTADTEVGPARKFALDRALSVLGIKSAPIEVEIVSLAELRSEATGESSASICQRIWSWQCPSEVPGCTEDVCRHVAPPEVYP